MDSGFIFEPPSDEEIEEPQSEYEEDQGEEVDVEKPSKRAKQSPWDFAAYSESVSDEHFRRRTTSVDFKITKSLQQRSVPIVDNDHSDSELDQHEDYKPEDEDDFSNAGDTKSFFAPADGASFHANSFMELNLSRPLLRACEALGYSKPTPIQAACIPLALTGRDICGSAITGSGKTAAFALPTLERLLYRPKRIPAIRVLILTPTRELAVQVHSMIEKIAQFTDIRCCLVVGGLSTKMQETALRSMPDIVVATPGRMIDHLRNSMSVDLDDLAVLILDEADRLLELGFSAEIHELVRLCPKRRQTMLFSATLTEDVDELIKLSLTKPLRLSADPSAKRPSTLTEDGTKQAAHRLKILFGLAALKAAELHGNLTQAQRLEALELFRKQHVDFLIATDVAARGLDIIGVQTVINYACPRDLTRQVPNYFLMLYVHRVGRTARAGREGYAVTFVTDNDRSLLKAIAKRAGSKLKSRIVAEQSITKWSKIIEQMEDQVAAILQEEREERILRKAEMEATKVFDHTTMQLVYLHVEEQGSAIVNMAENMIAHKEEIFARPKKTWFVTEKEKKLAAKADKASIEKGKGSGNEVTSAQQAEDLKIKEKRKREREKNLPRKERRKLEAAREMLEDEDQVDKLQGSGKDKKEKAGISMVDLAYRRAKAVKAKQKALDAGKIVKSNGKKSKHSSQESNSRAKEMRELFHSDMSEKKQKRTGAVVKSSHTGYSNVL
ncbi:DEAD-box ATP-dependent RNA helicase 28 [Citrus sinensis]|uniref:DEAD-box ATP-dependent RNA helicase 28 n=1 Tax=Citrus sinensis TaxID=2711 RepID=A0ACB8KXX2_CITSI|nr:DEAD-box ATP-dependent RNA helicase 28 [Citrus sinensis]